MQREVIDAAGRTRSPVELSVLLPTKNAGPQFRKVLDAICGQRIDTPFEVLLVDSGSTDGTPELAAKYPVRLHRIQPEAFGHGRTRNLLAQLARGRVLVMLSQDALPFDSAWLSKLTSPLASPRVAASFGRQIPQPQASPMQRYFLAQWYPGGKAHRTLAGPATAMTETLFYSHVNSALKKDVWQRMPFKEDLIMSEDQHWARQVLGQGYTIVYAPDAIVTHSHPYTLRSVFKRNFDSGASLRDITTDTAGDWLRHGLRYVAGELGFLVRTGHSWQIPYACLYEAMRFAGFSLGSHHPGIPTWLKRRLSQHAYHWDRRGDHLKAG